eukprot:scaffold16761_cov142-Isochrysis_galbana.AAC.9
MILDACAKGELPEGLTCGDIIVLYKKGDSREVRNYRPDPAEAGPTQDNHRRKRPVGSQWEP